MRKEWMNFLQWQNLWKSKNPVMLKLSQMLIQINISHQMIKMHHLNVKWQKNKLL